MQTITQERLVKAVEALGLADVKLERGADGYLNISGSILFVQGVKSPNGDLQEEMRGLLVYAQEVLLPPVDLCDEQQGEGHFAAIRANDAIAFGV